ncbi:ATPase [Flavobacterium sp. NST-5]|uniref:ATPase n=1 Tax=Flavobacterium ichthyis TaxID=2698827 RepID=A0ABW9Z7J9_9FLAO|nr:glycosyltransferase [Flavobacterium ichthyis]NBL64848.1 ATPase [Flavobacterium ichthyis]
MLKLLRKKIRKKFNEVQQFHSDVRFYDGSTSVIYLKLPHRTKVRTYLNLFVFLKKSFPETKIVLAFSLFRYFVLAKWFSVYPELYFKRPFKKISKLRSFSTLGNPDFLVNFNYEKVYGSDEFVPEVLPYIMHPQNYLADTNTIYNGRFCGILISGNFAKNIYDTPVMQEKFGIKNRYQILESIKQHQKTIFLTGDEFVGQLNSGILLDKLVVMSWSNGAIPSEKWRYYLSSAKFILCTPGMTMPLCHNVLEALSVGTVPIVNYPHWLNPSLKDGENCLVYSDNLHEVIDKSLNMSGEEYEKLSENVISFYQKYYQSFDFDEHRGGKITLVNENSNDLPSIKR